MDRYNTHYKLVFAPVEPKLWIDITELIICLIGIIINLILIYVASLRLRRAADTNLILILSALDTLSCGFMIFSIIIRWIYGSKVLILDGAWCQFSSLLFCGCTVAAVIITAVLSLARYLTIVRGFDSKKIHWTVLGIFLGLGIPAMFLIRSLVCKTVIPPSGLYCTPQFWGPDLDNKFFGITLILLIIPSLITMPFCYSKLTLHYHQLVSQIYISNSKYRFNTSIYSLIGVIVTYSIATLPEFILVSLTISHLAYRTADLDGIVIILLSTISIINGLFSLLMHDETRREFYKIIGQY